MYYTSNKLCLLGNSYISFRAGPRDPPAHGPAIAIPYGIDTENTEGAKGTPHDPQTIDWQMYYTNNKFCLLGNSYTEDGDEHRTPPPQT